LIIIANNLALSKIDGKKGGVILIGKTILINITPVLYLQVLINK
jgi:hypothetical protein